MDIRPATEADVGAITACVEEAYSVYIPRIGKPPGPMLDDYNEVVSDAEVYVANVSGELAGVLVLVDCRDGVLLDNVAVAPGYQGMGIGKALVDHAESVVQARGYGHLELYTHQLMTENMGFYERRGYREVRRVSERGYERVYMRKNFLS